MTRGTESRSGAVARERSWTREVSAARPARGLRPGEGFGVIEVSGGACHGRCRRDRLTLVTAGLPRRQTTASGRKRDADVPRHASNAVEQRDASDDRAQLDVALARGSWHGRDATEPAVGDSRTWLGLDDFGTASTTRSTTRCGRSARTSRSGCSEGRARRRPLPGGTRRARFLAGDCRNGARTTVTDTQVTVPAQPVRHQHLAEGVQPPSASPPSRDGSQRALLGPGSIADPTTIRRATASKIVTLVDNVRDDNFYDFGQRERELVHRRVLLEPAERVLRPQRDDDRRVRLAPPHRREPAEQPGLGRHLHERAGAPVPLRGHVRARVPAPARELRGSGRGQLGQRGPLGLGADADRLRQPSASRSPTRASTRTSSASSAGCRSQTPANPNPRAACGPENSLTRWGDQGDGEILADYGAAYSMMEMLQGRYGNELHDRVAPW